MIPWRTFLVIFLSHLVCSLLQCMPGVHTIGLRPSHVHLLFARFLFGWIQRIAHHVIS